jgi:hypothetical protein
MDFVKEKDCAASERLSIQARTVNGLANVFHATCDCAQFNKASAAAQGNHLRDGSFSGTRRAPKNDTC